MNHRRRVFIASGLVLGTALLAAGCTPPTPVTPCSDTVECPAHFHCDVEHSFCVPDRADGSVATADASSGDHTSSDRAASDQGVADARRPDAAATDRSGSDRARGDTAGDDRFDAGNSDRAGSDHGASDRVVADTAVRDAAGVDHGHHDAAAGDWWDPAWRLRTLLFVDNSEGTEDLIDFPLLVELTAARFDFAAARSDLGDVRFIARVDSQWVELAAELDSRESTPRALYWVSVPLVPAGATTTIWLYHGNPLAGPGSRAASEVWSHYAGVWHLNDGLADATSNGNSLLSFGSTAAAGRFGEGRDLAGQGEHLHTAPAEPSALAIAGDMTASLWAHLRSQDRNNYYSNPLLNCGHHDAYVSDYLYALNIGMDDIFRSYWESPAAIIGESTVPIGYVSDGWHHFSYTRTFAGESLVFYVDGAPLGDPVRVRQAPDPYTDTAVYIGVDPYDDLNLNLDAFVDEPRIEAGARSASWIAAIHRSETLQMVSFGPIGGY